MGCSGEAGIEARTSTTKEVLSVINELGLLGQLQKTIHFHGIYGSPIVCHKFSDLSREELLHRIVWPPFVNLSETPLELIQSILLRNLEAID